MNDNQSLKVKLPVDLALEAQDLFSDIDLNVTQSVIATLKLGIKSRRNAESVQGATNGSAGTDK